MYWSGETKFVKSSSLSSRIVSVYAYYSLFSKLPFFFMEDQIVNMFQGTFLFSGSFPDTLFSYKNVVFPA